MINFLIEFTINLINPYKTAQYTKTNKIIMVLSWRTIKNPYTLIPP